jgi:hypothetical protein
LFTNFNPEDRGWSFHFQPSNYVMLQLRNPRFLFLHRENPELLIRFIVCRT